MSVTVSDILKLPSMRDARVAGGESGLDRIVDSVIVYITCFFVTGINLRFFYINLYCVIIRSVNTIIK